MLENERFGALLARLSCSVPFRVPSQQSNLPSFGLGNSWGEAARPRPSCKLEVAPLLTFSACYEPSSAGPFTRTRPAPTSLHSALSLRALLSPLPPPSTLEPRWPPPSRLRLTRRLTLLSAALSRVSSSSASSSAPLSRSMAVSGALQRPAERRCLRLILSSRSPALRCQGTVRLRRLDLKPGMKVQR